MKRILIAHNAYQHRGGEDAVVEAEIDLLRSQGHEVEVYLRHNDELTQMSSVRAARDLFWSPTTTTDVGRFIANFKPDLIHAHNTFPLVSPSLYGAARRARIPVVQTLHNFRLICPQAMLLRDGNICEDCVGKMPWQAVRRRCYRDSLSQSAALASMLVVHRGLGTYRHGVTRYIALTQFSRNKFVAGGLPAQRIDVKSNFAPGGPIEGAARYGFLYVGRLSPEKGLPVLARAMRQLDGLMLRAAGSGPEAALLDGVPDTVLLGALPAQEIQAEMGSAMALVLPSICYEGFPRTLVEAYAAGLPVIGSRLGAMAELIEDGITGLLFNPGDASDLAEKMRWAQEHPEDMARMGRAARACYEANYTPETNYRQLLAIYQRALRDVEQERGH